MKLSEFMKCTILFFPLVASTPQSATAGDFDLIWRASDVEMDPVSWTGFIFNPEGSYNTLNLNGPGGEFLSDPKGFRAGLELEYDYQIDNIVVGVAGDGFYSWMDGGSSDKVSGKYKSQLPYMGSLRGRLGYDYQRFMVYGTGGLALARLEIEDRVTGTTDGHTMTGWVAGAGIEYAWNKNITARLEYLHSDFGSHNYASLPIANDRVSPSMNLINFNIVTRF